MHIYRDDHQDKKAGDNAVIYIRIMTPLYNCVLEYGKQKLTIRWA